MWQSEIWFSSSRSGSNPAFWCEVLATEYTHLGKRWDWAAQSSECCPSAVGCPRAGECVAGCALAPHPSATPPTATSIHSQWAELLCCSTVSGVQPLSPQIYLNGVFWVWVLVCWGRALPVLTVFLTALPLSALLESIVWAPPLRLFVFLSEHEMPTLLRPVSAVEAGDCGAALVIPLNSLITKLPFRTGCAVSHQRFSVSNTAWKQFRLCWINPFNPVGACLPAPVLCFQKAVGFAQSLGSQCFSLWQDVASGQTVYLFWWSAPWSLFVPGYGEGKAGGGAWLSLLSVDPLQRPS